MAYDSKFARRLSNAMSASRNALRPFREFRVKALKLAGGKHYGDKSGRHRPANQVASGLDVYTRLLVNRLPEVSITTDIAEYESQAYYFQEAVGKRLREIHYAETLQAVLIDALVLWGITKRGLTVDKDHVWEYESADTELDLTKPFIRRVSPDDFIVDMRARSLESVQFIGDIVDVDYEAFVSSGKYTNTDQVRPKDVTGSKVSDTAGGMSKNASTEAEGLFRTVRIAEMYIPRDNTVVTLPVDGGEIMRVQDYDGCEQGPYNVLSFRLMPDNVAPFSPAMEWLDLDEAVNRLLRKFINQAERSKIVPAARKNAKRDALTIRNTNDGEIVLLDNPEAVKELKFGGIDQQNWAFTMWMLNQLNVVQGNPEALAGLGPTSDTARQEQQILQRAGLKVDDMRIIVEKFVTRDTRALAWYEWTEPIRETPITVSVDGVGELRSVFSPWVREGDFLDYMFDVVPYSMSQDKPEEQAAKLKELASQIIIPLQPALQAAGKMFDVEKFINILSEKERIKGMDALIVDAPEQGGQGQQERPRQSPVTSREYIRRSVSGMSNSGFNQSMIQSLMYGASPQQQAG